MARLIHHGLRSRIANSEFSAIFSFKRHLGSVGGAGAGAGADFAPTMHTGAQRCARATFADLHLQATRRQRIARGLLWITPALWSSNYIIARASEGVIAPHALALGRWTLALALLLPLSAGALHSGFSRWKHEWQQMLLLGALGMWICGAFVYQGAHTTSAINIGLIYAATPVAIAWASTQLLGERVSGWQRAGMALALRRCGLRHRQG